jgi:CspA family cold shock protein
MPSGHVKVFHTERSFGFVSGNDGDEVYFHADVVEGGPAGSGDEVDFEVNEPENPRERAATTVTITKKAVDDNPIGRTMTAPPTWDQLEERERARRQARRRRR